MEHGMRTEGEVEGTALLGGPLGEETPGVEAKLGWLKNSGA